MLTDLHVNLKEQDVTEVEITVKAANEGKLVTAECLQTLFLYLFTCLLIGLLTVLFLFTLLGSAGPTQQFSSACSFFMAVFQRWYLKYHL